MLTLPDLRFDPGLEMLMKLLFYRQPEKENAEYYTVYLGRAPSPKLSQRFHLKSKLILQAQGIWGHHRIIYTLELWQRSIFHLQTPRSIWSKLKDGTRNVHIVENQPLPTGEHDAIHRDNRVIAIMQQGVPMNPALDISRMRFRGGEEAELYFSIDGQHQCVWKSLKGDFLILKSFRQAGEEKDKSWLIDSVDGKQTTKLAYVERDRILFCRDQGILQEGAQFDICLIFALLIAIKTTWCRQSEVRRDER